MNDILSCITRKTSIYTFTIMEDKLNQLEAKETIAK